MFNRIIASAGHKRDEGYIISVAKWVTILMIIGIFLYKLTNGWGTLVALSIAIAVLLGRFMLTKQAEGDFRDMHEAKRAYIKTKNKDYLRFIQARAEQMLNDNKMLTKPAKEEIHGLLNDVKKILGNPTELCSLKESQK